jgi:hypothetical protein
MLISKPNFEYSQVAFRLLPHPKIKRHNVPAERLQVTFATHQDLSTVRSSRVVMLPLLLNALDCL